MNLILLDSLALKQKLPASDRRSVHVREVLGTAASELFVGVANGAMGKARVVLGADGEVELEIVWFSETNASSVPSVGVSLLLPYCRPQTCRKILREAASLGVSRLVFFRSAKAEIGYAQSSLWRTGEWQEHLLTGVEQAFTTEVPELHRFDEGIAEAIVGLSALSESQGGACRIALDNYESTAVLGQAVRADCSHWLAIGAERGWSARERDALRANGFTLAHMGSRVMRTETAVVAACSVVAQLSGQWHCDTARVVPS